MKNHPGLAAALVTLCCALITTFLVPWLKQKLDLSTLQKSMEYIEIAVSAAEQLFGEPGTGDAKKEYALSLLGTLGVGQNLPLDAMVEAAVNALFPNRGE